MSALAVAFCVAAVAILAPLWAPLVLAAWIADLLRPTARKFERHLGGRRRAAGVLIVLVAVGLLAPLIGAALANSTLEFLGQVRAALEGQGSLAAVLLGGGSDLHGERTRARRARNWPAQGRCRAGCRGQLWCEDVGGRDEPMTKAGSISIVVAE